MKNIEHIVYIMLENRSQDQVLGWLYENDTPSNFIPSHKNEPYEGLKENTYYNCNLKGERFYVKKVPASSGQDIPHQDPYENFSHVQNQIRGGMKGFYNDYASDNWQTYWEQIMWAFSPDTLPIMNSLAKKFAVSDAYFSSVPTQTDCNRAFSLTGNSIHHSEYSGLVADVDNISWSQSFYYPTIWNVLTNNHYDTKKDWMIFYSNLNVYKHDDTQDNLIYTKSTFKKQIGGESYAEHFAKIEEFYGMLAGGSEEPLPKFSYLEPSWFGDTVGTAGNDYHPGHNVASGEHLLYSLYSKIKNSPKRDKILLIINFDEHGGTYDHITPPSNAKAPWDNPSDGIPIPDATRKGFDFTQFGVRVPLILVSPYIEENTVIRSATETPFDHTSVIATILKSFFNIPKSKWKLGSRVANAPTFENVLTRTTPRTGDDLDLPAPLSGLHSSDEIPPNDLQIKIMKRMFAHYAEDNNYSEEDINEIYHKNFNKVKTLKDFMEAAERMFAELDKK